MNCTLCDSKLTNKKDEYYYECDTCKAIVKNKIYYLSADKEKTRYESHNNNVDDIGYQNFTSPITNYVIQEFTSKHKGLDFGCGTGPVISSMLQKQSYNITQYDPFFVPNEDVLKSTYDYIVSCEVFEHFYNPKEEIIRLISLLKNNGVLLVMTMLYNEQIDFNSWFYRKDPTHVFIYRKETFEYIAQKHKLEIVSLTNRFIALRKS
ncbi:class I SAM-dependent methyltransferase [Tenacibaculum sp. S7007]|uniref:Class I SAM-dependent methyltransferase n=1 Tax=Tenacibaculum pelagium TaxID=2759527 RepID=A0A839AN52_9FLAO|nr:class I SAM-dependent methyltransferase [Tenacibaculum pelagium]MBA6156525.1 class I SAM-dependent methyltransferase [Tenacibaculum pelagium]